MSTIRAVFLPLLTFALLSLTAGAHAQMVVSLPYTSDGLNPAVYFDTFDATTGAFQFVDGIGGVSIGEGVIYGPDGLMYLATGVCGSFPGCTQCSCASNVIFALDYDGSAVPTGSQFNSGDTTLNNPRGLAWGVVNGADKLFAAGVGGGHVLRYAANGVLEGAIWDGGGSQFIKPYGIAVDDKALYIANFHSVASNIYKIDTDTGAALDDPDDGDVVFAQLTLESPSGLDWWPQAVAVGPNGDVYLSAAAEDPGPGTSASFAGGAIFRISNSPMSDGAVISSFKDPTGTVLNYPQDMTFGDDGKLYVANANDGGGLNGSVERFTIDLQHDATFIPADPYGSGFSHLAFMPTACRDGQDNDSDGLIDLADPGCLAVLDSSENDAAFPCDDGVDNDNDGLTDYPEDIGCDSRADTSERSPLLPCDDGVDNDGDGRIDFDPVTAANPGNETTPPAGNGDPGCGNAAWPLENPQCSNGIDDDGQTGTDYDGGAFMNGGTAIDVKDPNCGNPWKNKEAANTGRCSSSISPIEGLSGGPLAAMLLLLALLAPDPRRRRSVGLKH